MKIVNIMNVSDEDGSIVMEGFLLPEDFEVPEDWEKIDISVFSPGVPTNENLDNALDQLGVIVHKGENNG